MSQVKNVGEQPFVAHIMRAAHMYKVNHVEYSSLKVTSRGLFLAVAVMFLFLWAFDWFTHLLPGTNEIVVPLISVPESSDIGANVRMVFEQSQGVFVDFVGFVTLFVSALFTAQALRLGTRWTMLQDTSLKLSRFQMSNLLLGLLVALIVLVSWLLILITAVRSAAWRELLANDLSGILIQSGKFLAIALCVTLYSVATYFSLRKYTRAMPLRFVIWPVIVFSAFSVGADFVLLYINVADLVNPAKSGAFVLLLTMVGWVNIVVRAFFFLQCWICSTEFGSSDPPVHPSA